jgi:hypothetical protein
MKFPEITIPDPAHVWEMLKSELPTTGSVDKPRFGPTGWHCVYWLTVSECLVAEAASPFGLMQILKEKTAAHDPLAKLRKEWEAMGKPDLNNNNPATGRTPSDHAQS